MKDLQTIELITLSILSSGEKYGYELYKELHQLKTLKYLGKMYTVLKRLERKECVSSRWGEEEDSNNARRKYYSITDQGRQALKNTQDLIK